MSMFQTDLLSLQNSALGGTILWRFCRGYEAASKKPGVPLPLAFIVLPITLNPISRAVLQSTQLDSGLIAFAAKFSAPPVHVAKSKVDGIEVRHGKENLLALNNRMISFRSLTLRSLAVAFSTNLLSLDADHGSLHAVSVRPAPQTDDADIKEMLRTALKLGEMIAPHSLSEVCGALGVAL